MTLVSRGEKGGFDVEKGVYVLDDETEVAAVDEDADEKLVDADDVVDEDAVESVREPLLTTISVDVPSCGAAGRLNDAGRP